MRAGRLTGKNKTLFGARDNETWKIYHSIKNKYIREKIAHGPGTAMMSTQLVSNAP